MFQIEDPLHSLLKSAFNYVPDNKFSLYPQKLLPSCSNNPGLSKHNGVRAEPLKQRERRIKKTWSLKSVKTSLLPCDDNSITIGRVVVQKFLIVAVIKIQNRSSSNKNIHKDSLFSAQLIYKVVLRYKSSKGPKKCVVKKERRSKRSVL